MSALPTVPRHRGSSLSLLRAATAATLLSAGCGEMVPLTPPIAVPDDAVSASRAAFEYTFTALPMPAGTRSSTANGISPDGTIVGTYADAAGRQHGFRLSAGVLTTIDHPGAITTIVRGISPSGEMVGNYRRAGEPWFASHSFRLTPDGVFTPIEYPGHRYTIIQRILPDGTVLGCRHDHDLMSTMRGIAIGPHGHSETDAFASMHNGATPDGSRIAGLYTDMMTGRTTGYLIDRGVFQPLTVPGSTVTTAWDMNPAGEIVGVHRNASGFHGFVLGRDGYADVDVPGASATRVFGTNPRGDVVGSFVQGGVTRAFVATRSHRRN